MNQRTLKFRAWNKIKKIMVYNDEDNCSDYWDGCCLSDIEMVNNCLENVRAYAWMQFTGLHDKNGKKIYEGDLVKFEGYTKDFTSPVVFENGAFTIDISKSGLETNGDYYNWGLANGWTLGTKSLHNGHGTMEIIGNIYENPELLANKN